MDRSHRRNWPGIGLAGVLVAFVGLGSLYAFTVPRFLPADETSHVGYALTVGHGHLPALDSPVPDEIPHMALYFEIRRQIYTANHPPLYYLPVAAPLRLGVHYGHPIRGLVVARLLTVAMTALGGLATWWTARMLLPKRPDLAVLAAALALLLPAVPRFSGVVYNDGFALAVSAMAIAVGARLLTHGPSRRLVIAAAAAAAALALTRAVGIAGAALVAAAAAASVLIHDPRPMRTRWWRALASGTAVALAAFVASGWFWIRNLRRYGDIAGSAYNLDRFGYSRRGSTLAFLMDLKWPRVLHRQMWGRIYDSANYAKEWGAVPGNILLALVALGLVVLVVRALRDQARPVGSVWRTWSPTDRGRVAACLLLVAWAGLVYVSTIGYTASGGGFHARYLFPAVPALAIIAAAALGALPGRRHAIVPVLTVVTLVWIGLQWAAKFADTLRPDSLSWANAITTNASVYNGTQARFVWTAVALAVIGAVATCAAMVALARPETIRPEGLDAPGPGDDPDRPGSAPDADQHKMFGGSPAVAVPGGVAVSGGDPVSGGTTH